MKKKLKHRLTGGKRKPGETAANPDGERTDSMSSLPQPEPHAVAGKSYGREGDRANVAGERDFVTDPPPQPAEPESVSAREGDNGQGGEVADVDGGEASQRHSHPHPDVEVGVESGCSRGPEGVHPSPSTPSISHGGKLDGMWTWSFLLLSLTIPSDNIDAPAIPDHGPDVVRPDESLEPGAAADEKEPSCKSAASATAELLRGVRDSTSAFGPLRSIAGSLCLILDNYEVWPRRTSGPQCLRPFQRTEVNEYAIESLAPRVKTLSEDLSIPIPPGDADERERANELER